MYPSTYTYIYTYIYISYLYIYIYIFVYISIFAYTHIHIYDIHIYSQVAALSTARPQRFFWHFDFSSFFPRFSPIFFENLVFAASSQRFPASKTV